jgi:hypothetical protein
MTDKIEPALSAEEWDMREATREDTHVRLDWFNGPPTLYIDNLSNAPLSISDECESSHGGVPALIAMIALTNATLPDTDPRKITWGMVDAIRDAEPSWGERDTEGLALLRHIADALASYLPPRVAP